MCGIFFYKNGEEISSELEELLINYLNRIQHRGPDDTSYIISNDRFIGFHRLAINGLSEKGDQPFEYDREDGSKDYIVPLAVNDSSGRDIKISIDGLVGPVKIEGKVPNIFNINTGSSQNYGLAVGAFLPNE